jgi:Domain of unknown function (DUF4157)
VRPIPWRRRDRALTSFGSSHRAEVRDPASAAISGTVGHRPRSNVAPGSSIEVICAETLSRAPAWSRVTPPAPLLDDMPLALTRRFETSLVAWRRPVPFLAPLGHGVSDMAPVGLIKLDASVIQVSPTSESEISPEDITLVHPVTDTSQSEVVARQREVVGHRTATGAVGERGAATETEDHGSRHRVSAQGWVVRGAKEGEAVRIVTSVPKFDGAVAPRATEGHPDDRAYVSAATPPDFPLVHLKVPAHELVHRGPADLLKLGASNVQVRDGELGPDAAMAAHHQVSPGRDGDPPQPLPDQPRDPGIATTDRPTLGLPRVGTEDAEPRGALHPEGGRRAGLGRPLDDVPRTAMPFDITKMSPVAQRREARRLALAQLPSMATQLGIGATALPGAVRDGTVPISSGFSTGSPAAAMAPSPGSIEPPTYVPAGLALVVAPLARAAPGPRGRAPDVEDDDGTETTVVPTLATQSTLSPSETQPWWAPQSPQVWMPGTPPATGSLLPTMPRRSQADVGTTHNGWNAPLLPARARPVLGESQSEGVGVRTVIGQRHDLDLSNVRLDRSPEGQTQARAMGAQAFSSEERIVLPPSAGPLDGGRGAALLAHELTHVAQRARFGPLLPPEHTPAGQTLEAEATMAERQAAGLKAAGHNGARLPVVPTAPTVLKVSSSPTYEADPSASLGRFDGVASPAGSPSVVDGGTSASDPGSGGPTATVAPPVASPPGLSSVQRASEVPNPPEPASPAEPEGMFATRPSESDLSHLARWLYPLISYRIKGELRENRERAGLLTDNYRRW